MVGLERELVDARGQAQTSELARVEVQQGLERRIQVEISCHSFDSGRAMVTFYCRSVVE